MWQMRSILWSLFGCCWEFEVGGAKRLIWELGWKSLPSEEKEHPLRELLVLEPRFLWLEKAVQKLFSVAWKESRSFGVKVLSHKSLTYEVSSKWFISSAQIIEKRKYLSFVTNRTTNGCNIVTYTYKLSKIVDERSGGGLCGWKWVVVATRGESQSVQIGEIDWTGWFGPDWIELGPRPVGINP